jgi:hypothetical protein
MGKCMCMWDPVLLNGVALGHHVCNTDRCVIQAVAKNLVTTWESGWELQAHLTGKHVAP